MPLKTCLTALLLLAALQPVQGQTIPATGDSLTGGYREVRLVFSRSEKLDRFSRIDLVDTHEPFFRILNSAEFDSCRYVFNTRGQVTEEVLGSTRIIHTYRGTLPVEVASYGLQSAAGGKQESVFLGRTVFGYDGAGRLLAEKEYRPPNRGADSSGPLQLFVKAVYYSYEKRGMHRTMHRYLPPDTTHAAITEREDYLYRDGMKQPKQILRYADGGWLEQRTDFDKNGDFTRYNYAPSGALHYTTRLEYTAAKKFKARRSWKPDGTTDYESRYFYENNKIVRIECTYGNNKILEVTGYNSLGLATGTAVSKNGVLLYRRVNSYDGSRELHNARYFAPDGDLLFDYSLRYAH